MNAITRRKYLRTAHEIHEPDSAPPLWLTGALAVGAGTAAVAALVLAVIFAMFYAYTRDYVPIEGKLADRFVGLTEVYDRGGPGKGVFLGTLSNPNAQLLDPVPLEEISPNLITATISTEDNSFWNNPGVSVTGIVRAAWDNYVHGGIVSGGSTITQQLVKNVYLSTDCSVVGGVRSCVAPRTFARKIEEVTYSLELDRHYSKTQILTWYLNQVSYADRYVGVQAAAQGYFREDAKDLDLAQAALLAGIPAAPTTYHPRLNCQRNADGACVVDAQGRTLLAGAAKARQEEVLNLMVLHHRITQAQAVAALAEPLLIYPDSSPANATAWIDDQVEPRLVRMCEAGILPMTPGTSNCADSVHNGGYKVTSTLDYNETQKAEQTMRQWISWGLKAGCNCHDASIVTIDPPTGQVMIYAPSVDPTYVSDPRVAGDIDEAMDINQPGSSFKPVVYTAWFQLRNKTPMSSIWDTNPLILSDPGSNPGNAVSIINPGTIGTVGLITARAALGGSQNVPAVRVAEEVGIDNVIAFAKKMGITTLQQGFDPTWYDHPAIHYGPSIATGGANVRVFDMAYMNATIANMGTMVGVPTLARTLDMNSLISLSTAKGADYQTALDQKQQFQLGYTRLPGSRLLDPVTVLQVESIDGKVLYQEGQDLQKLPVVDAANAWMTFSIQSDCTARFIIWTCGSSNDDNDLDAFMPDGTKIPMGIKTGTQQGFSSASATLATWMNGYTRYAATAVWVGNANKVEVRDGPQSNFASADATIRLFKNWMSQYHQDLKDKGVFEGEPAGFSDLQPSYVALRPYQSAATERGMRGGCSQVVTTWVRTDITYPGDCQGKSYMPLPAFQTAEAIVLARQWGIPISGSEIGAAVPPVVANPTASTPTTAARPPAIVPPRTPRSTPPPPTAPSPRATAVPTTRPATPTSRPAAPGSTPAPPTPSPVATATSPPPTATPAH